MLSISHGVTGAFVASQLPHPAAYVPIAVGLHYLQDWIPHWDVGTGLSNGKRKKSHAFLFGLLDLALMAGVIIWFWGNPLADSSWHIWFGAIAGLLPDFLEAPKNFLGVEPKFLKPLNAFHDRFHTSIPNIAKGLLPQAILLIVIWWLR